MAKADEIQIVTPHLCVWGAYSNEVKTEMMSAAYIKDGSMVLVDPIALEDEALNDLLKLGEPRSIVLTNANHLRDAARYREQYRIPVAAAVDARHELGKEIDVILLGNETIHGLKPVAIPGAAPGETAYLGTDGPRDGVLFLGDAILHVKDRLEFLPAKYAVDPRQSRESLRALVDLPFSTITFAHGWPLTQNAKATLKTLIES